MPVKPAVDPVPVRSVNVVVNVSVSAVPCVRLAENAPAAVTVTVNVSGTGVPEVIETCPVEVQRV